ncbi:MAG: hypothetical protein ACJ71F_00430 [Nitrososphaeraceae archaeon]
MTTGRYIGHVVRETDDKIVIFGDRNDRYDIPKSEIQTTGRNVLIGLNLDEIAKKYKIKHEAQVPTSLPLEHWTRGENLGLAWLITVIKNGINPYKINTIIQSSVLK